jgi:hypothetical protein
VYFSVDRDVGLGRITHFAWGTPLLTFLISYLTILSVTRVYSAVDKMTNECRAAGMRIGMENRSTGRNLAPLLLYPLQIPPSPILGVNPARRGGKPANICQSLSQVKS